MKFDFAVQYQGDVVIPARNGAEASELACALILMASSNEACSVGGGWSCGKGSKITDCDPAWLSWNRSILGNRSLYRIPLTFNGTATIEAAAEKDASQILCRTLKAVCGANENPDHCVEPFEDRNVPEKYMHLYDDLLVAGSFSVLLPLNGTP